MKEGWRMVKLGEVSSFQNGFAFKSTLFKNEGEPIIRISNIQDEKLSTNDLVYFNPKDYKVNFDLYRIFPNDILIAMSGGTTGKLGINQDDRIYYQNQRVGVIREKADVLCRQYLYYFLQTKTEESLKIAAGAAQPNLSTAQINNFDLPLPPLEEQHRIVFILDASFEKIDALKKNAEENLKNAKALFQQVLAQELKPKEGWVEKKLGEVSKEIFAGGDAPKQNMSKTITEQYPIPIYANAVEEDGLYGFTNNARVNEPAITIAARGSGTGYVLRRKVPFLPIVRLIVIIPNPSIEMDYMYYALKSINIRKAGAAIPQLTVPMLREYKISFPIDIKEQHRIVQTLDTLSKKCRRLEEIAQQTIRECDALKQSILRQAFSGEL